MTPPAPPLQPLPPVAAYECHHGLAGARWAHSTHRLAERQRARKLAGAVGLVRLAQQLLQLDTEAAAGTRRSGYV